MRSCSSSASLKALGLVYDLYGDICKEDAKKRRLFDEAWLLVGYIPFSCGLGIGGLCLISGVISGSGGLGYFQLFWIIIVRFYAVSVRMAACLVR
jgi:hypothetical protein